MNQSKKNNKNSKYSQEILNKVNNLMKNNLKMKKIKSSERVIKVNAEKLHELYMKWVDQVAEDCDWKTHFTPDEIVHSIARIIENNPDLISVD